MQKIVSGILIFMLVFSNISTLSYAENSEKNNRVKTAESIAEETKKAEKSNTSAETKEAEKKEEKKEEKKAEENKEPTGPDVKSDAAILINSNTGKILYEKNSHKRMFPASTTKIMTAHLALNALDLSAQITASKNAVEIPWDSSKLGIKEGEILTVKDLLYALMVQSANDAANVLAEAVSGSIPEFVNLMNQTAQELGMENTLFANPHGYHDDNHYTTAYDMSVLAKKAMENPIFAEIVGTRSYEIAPTNLCEESRKFRNRNTLISTHSNVELQYTYANGIKTGSTEKAGQCLVGSARRNGMDLISVTFFAPKDMPNRSFIDTKNLFSYAYSKYQIKTVLKADALASTCNVKWAFGKSHLILKSDFDVKALLPKTEYYPERLTSEIHINEKIVAPIKKGTPLGEIRYYYNNEEVAVAKLLADRDVSRSYVKQILSYLLNIWFLIFLGIVVVIILLRRRKAIRRAAKIQKIKARRNGRE